MFLVDSVQERETAEWDQSSDDEEGECSEAGAAGSGSANALALFSAAMPTKATPSVCRFHTCGASSNDVKWFQVFIGRDGEQPVGPYCLKCGMAAEAWPLMSKEEVEHKVKTRADFRKEFFVAQAAVEAAMTRLLPRDNVFSETKMGCRVLVQTAFVDIQILTAKYTQVVAALPNVPIVEVTGPENATVRGVLFKLDEHFRQQQLPRYIIEVYSDAILTVRNTLLHETEMLRECQAADLFVYHTKETAERRFAGLRTAKLPETMNLAEYQEKVKAKQEELKAKELQAAQQNITTDAADSSGIPAEAVAGLGQLRSASRLAGPCMMPVSTPAKKVGKRLAKDSGAGVKAAAAVVLSGPLVSPPQQGKKRRAAGSGGSVVDGLDVLDNTSSAGACLVGASDKRKKTPRRRTSST